MREFRLPDLGEGLTEAEIVRWLVRVGDTVAVDQPVVEVETAKAAVEVPTPYAGVVSVLHGAAGDVIEVHSPLITVGESADAPSASDAKTDSGEDAAAESGSGNVLVGYGTSRRARRRSARSGSTTEAPPAASQARVAVISPVVRKLARDHRIDLGSIRGSGQGGLVRRADVQAAIDAAVKPVSPAVSPSGEDGERIPLTGLRRAAAERMSRSRREIPEATVWVDVDATELLAARKVINAADPDHPVSILAMIARFCVLGLRRFPALNSTVDTQAEQIVLHKNVNLGFAAQTKRGLVVPVVREAQRLSTRELSTQLGTLTASARDGSLAPADLIGGTFTVNNYGVFGVDGSAAIINHPEAAIVGIGRIVDRPWAVNGTLEVRKVTELTLAFDHRVCDGGDAGGFLRFVADCVERPTALLGDL